MTIKDRDAYIRNYVLGVLCKYHERGISIENIETIATEITEAVMEAIVKRNKEIIDCMPVMRAGDTITNEERN